MSGRVLLLVPTSSEARALLGDAAPAGTSPREIGPRHVVALCGFGPAAAGVLAAQAVDEVRPARVLLAGIAGTYRAGLLPVGGLLLASGVRAEIGRGRGAAFRSASDLGFLQVPGGAGGDDDVLRTLVPDAPPCPATPFCRGELLTVACASANEVEARERAALGADLLAEDMESFAVALACRRRDVPLTVLRAVSNVAGEADRAAWRTAEAFAALRDVLGDLLSALER